jgi:general secretion pathway protein F
LPQYSFLARNSKGKRIQGVITADTPAAARASLREQELVLLSCERHIALRPVRWSAASRLLFVQQLAQLLQAGLPIYEALQSLEQQARGSSHHTILFRLVGEIERGRSLSEAMGQFPEHFDGLMRALVASGELSGQLPETILRLEILLVRQKKIKSQLRQALTYPIVVLAVAFLIVIFLLLFSVPALEPLLEGKSLQGATAFLIGTSQGLRHHGIGIGLVTCAMVAGLVVWASRPQGTQTLLSIALRLPGIGKALEAGNLARFFRTLLTLIQGGLSVLDGLRIARQVSSLPTFRAEVQKIEKGLIQGKRLSQLVDSQEAFPAIVGRMLSLAETAGELSPSLQQLATFFEEETENRVSRLQQMLQPLILVVLGLVVGFIVMGILIPLTDVQQLVGESNG